MTALRTCHRNRLTNKLDPTNQKPKITHRASQPTTLQSVTTGEPMLNLILRAFCSLIGGFIGGMGVVLCLYILGATLWLAGIDRHHLTAGWNEDWALDLVMLLGILAGLIIGWILPTHIYNPRLCHHCRYNLTGNRTGQCPECGQPLTAAQRQLINP